MRYLYYITDMLLQLKNETAEYSALKKFEEELIKSLQRADMVALTKNAVELNLVPKETLSHIQCLDSNVPHSLVCRFLFFHVYTTIQQALPESPVHESFEKWLGVLLDLKLIEVSGVLSRLKQHQQSITSAIDSRSSLGGEILCMNDVPLLAEVFSVDYAADWEKIFYSLLVREIERLKPFDKLKGVITVWLQNHVAELANLQDLLKALWDALSFEKQTDFNSFCIFFRKELEVQGMSLKSRIDYLLSSLLQNIDCSIEKKDLSLLIPLLKSYHWRDVASSLQFSHEKIDFFTKLEKLTPVNCLEVLLTEWVVGQEPDSKCDEIDESSEQYPSAKPSDELQSPNAALPTFKTLGKALFHWGTNALQKQLETQSISLKESVDNRVWCILNGKELKSDDALLLTEALVPSEYISEANIRIFKDTEEAYSILLSSRLQAIIGAKSTESAKLQCLNEALSMWVSIVMRAPMLSDLEELLDRELKERLRLTENLLKCGRTKLLTRDNIQQASVNNSPLNLDVCEGKSTLLEVSSSLKEKLCFECEFDSDCREVSYTGVMNNFRGLSRFILCLHISDLSLDAFTCNIRSARDKDEAVLLSKKIYLSISTPIDQYRKVLTEFYNEQPEVPEDTWPPVGSVAYISLALIKQEGSTCVGQHFHDTIRGDVDDIYCDKESIMYDRAFDKLSSGSRLLVEGRPGSGKTTLVQKVSHDWANGKLNFLHNRLLFLVHLRAFSSDPNIGLRDVLKCYYSADSTINAIIEYAEKHNGLGLCFILDGLDEYMPGNDTFSYIFRLIRKQVLPKAAVIIASRPAASAKFRTIATRQIEVIGFLKEQIFEYIKKYPFSVATKRDELREYFEEHPNILHMCYLPIHSAMVCFLFDDFGTALPQTETKIYEEFNKHTILRMLYRCSGDRDYFESTDNLDEPQRSVYREICRLAFEMTVSSKQVMKQTEMQSFLRTKLREKDCLGLVTVDRTATRHGFQHMYTFLHLTFQEFLAACYISKQEETKQAELISAHANDKVMQQVWKFYCGLVNFSDGDQKFNALISNTEFGTLYKIQVCFESQQPHLCDIAVKGNSLTFKDMFLSASNFMETAYLISNKQSTFIEQFVLEGCTLAKEGIDVLVKKASSHKLGALTSLCLTYNNGCDIAQLHTINYFWRSLPSLKVLDISHSVLGSEKMNLLLKELGQLNLEIIKAGSMEYSSFCSLRLQIFESSLYLPGIAWFILAKTKLSFPHPSLFHCNPPHMVLGFRELSSLSVQALTSEFEINSVYTKIVLIDCGIDDFAASHLSRGIKHCADLRSVVLSFNQIGDDGALEIARALEFSSKINTLDMSFNRITNTGAMEIAEIVKNASVVFSCNTVTLPQLHQKVNTLSLSGREIEDIGAMCLASLMLSSGHCEDLLHLHLDRNKLSSDGLQPLSNAVMSCNNLLTLDLSHNTLGKRGAVILAPVLKQCMRLQTLDISHNFLGSDGAECIAGGLTYCHFLQEFRISSNCIGSNGISWIAKALEHCANLRVLEVNSNYLGSEGAELLSKSIRYWVELSALHISSNAILTEGARVLAQALRHIPTFRELYIADNKIENDGLKHLATVFENSTSLCALDITSNMIDVQQLDVSYKLHSHDHNVFLQDILKKSKSLHFLGTGQITMGMSVSLDFAEAIGSSQLLSRLDVSNNWYMSSELVFCLKDCMCLEELNISNCDLAFHDVCDLAESLQCLTEFRALYIGSNTLPAVSFEVLSRSLTNCPKLHKLHINASSIGDGSATAIADVLRHCRDLEELNLASNNIRSEGAKVIACALREARSLRELDISNNHITGEGEKVLSHAVMSSNIHCFSFGYTETNNSMQSPILPTSLYCYTNFEKLHLTHINVDVSTLATGLRFCNSLSELAICSNKIDGTGAKAIALALSKYCRQLCNFDISDNPLMQCGVKSLSTVLVKCPYLTHLNISRTGVDRSSIADIAQSLEHCKNLQTLNVSNNSLTNADVKILSKGLVFCQTFVHLDISSNLFEVDACVVDAVDRIVLSCSNFCVLNISQNLMHATYARSLANILKASNGIAELVVTNNRISSSHKEVLVSIFKPLTNIKTLTI